ncbi:MAG: BBP7 family outer membrane beta-barrel protein [Rubripirellula sp.]
MDLTKPHLARSLRALLVCAAALAPAAMPLSTATAQVRVKSPDRGVYQSPTLESVAVEEIPSKESADSKPRQSVSPAKAVAPKPRLQQVNHEDVVLIDPQSATTDGTIIGSGRVLDAPTIINHPPTIYEDSYDDVGGYGSSIGHDSSCDGCSACDGIGMGGCDGMGCNSCGGSGCGSCSNATICFRRDHWFGAFSGGVMFRSGDRLPALITTGPSTSSTTAGRLDQATTSVLSGANTEHRDASFGGLLKIGTWLDESQCRSMVFRGWAVTESSFGFDSTQDQNSVLVRPFTDTSVTPNAPSTIVVAFPDAAAGSVHVDGSSNVFGGDISVRQFWYGRYGGTVDLLYGYQYMRLDEDLNVSSTSLSQNGTFGPAGSVISISDSVEAINDFNGAQLGIASNYREGCWSFRSLAKLGFGAVKRTARRSGVTITENGADSFTDPQGLLVRDTNDGTRSSTTFGVVPELDLSLGWHRFPRFDVTLGYHLIAMTDALQVSGALDPNLSSNLSSPLVGGVSPSASLRYDTFYVQGIHLGLHYTY